jgi:hypothetical protein
MCKLFFLDHYIIPRFDFFEKLSLKSHQALLKVQICFSVVLISLAHLENTPKMFHGCLRIRQKYLIAFRECAKSLYAYSEITAIFEGFLFIQSRLRMPQKY